MNKIKKAVILAGGLGTRLAPFTDMAPKPMFAINGKPYIEYLIMQIKSFGISDILMLLGYLPDIIVDYIKDGSKWGVNVSYSISEAENETGKRLYIAKDMIDCDFLLLYCDNYCPMDFNKRLSNIGDYDIQITAYANRDGYTKNNLKIENGNVAIYDKTRTAQGLNAVDIGYAIVKRDVLNKLTGENVNFEKAVYPNVKLGAYLTEHRYYSIGSYERISLTEQFFKNEKVAFLDRDGTLNVKAPKAQYITGKEDFIWLEGAKEAVKLLNDNNYKVILVTNQPGISRGMMTKKDLHEIHDKMASDLSEISAKIDEIYYCPHGWNDGCICRKPRAGMLFQAQRDFNFNMENAIFFGDDQRDMQAAEEAGCRGIFIDENSSLLTAVKKVIKWR